MKIAVPLVTRGFGKNQRVVTTGYGPLIRRVLEAVKVIGGTAAKVIQRLPEMLYTVRAYFTRINSTDILPEITGAARKVVDPNIPTPEVSADLTNAQISQSRSEILIAASRSVRTKIKNGD
jgi:hypothetical protein